MTGVQTCALPISSRPAVRPPVLERPSLLLPEAPLEETLPPLETRPPLARPPRRSSPPLLGSLRPELTFGAVTPLLAPPLARPPLEDLLPPPPPRRLRPEEPRPTPSRLLESSPPSPLSSPSKRSWVLMDIIDPPLTDRRTRSKHSYELDIAPRILLPLPCPSFAFCQLPLLLLAPGFRRELEKQCLLLSYPLRPSQVVEATGARSNPQSTRVSSSLRSPLCSIPRFCSSPLVALRPRRSSASGLTKPCSCRCFGAVPHLCLLTLVRPHSPPRCPCHCSSPEPEKELRHGAGYDLVRSPAACGLLFPAPPLLIGSLLRGNGAFGSKYRQRRTALLARISLPQHLARSGGRHKTFATKSALGHPRSLAVAP